MKYEFVINILAGVLRNIVPMLNDIYSI